MADEASKTNNILSQIKEGQTKASEKQDKQTEVAKQAADAAVATKDANERIERLTEKVDERRKQKALDDKVAQAEQLEVLEERLAKRGDDAAKLIKQRLKRFPVEMELKEGFKFHFINDDLDETVNKVEKIIKENL